MKFNVVVLSLKLSLKRTFEVKDLSLKSKFAVMLSPRSSKSVLNVFVFRIVIAQSLSLRFKLEV